MTLFVQHGYGKSDKLEQLARHMAVDGVVLSPKDESPQTLRQTAKDALTDSLTLLVDPQTYMYSTEPQGSGRCHADNGLPTSRVSWAQDAGAVSRLVDAVGQLNADLGATRWVAPAPLQNLFVDEMTPLALQYARTASGAWPEGSVYASLVIDQHAFADWSAIERWLTEATTLEVSGFYLIVTKSSSAYPPAAWEPVHLANYLRLIYVLAEVADFDVVLGYADYEGVLGLACGASAMASGWSYSLRQLCPERWKVIQDGGAPPVSRVNMERLWSPVRAQADAEPVFESDLADMAFSERELAAFAESGFELDRPTAQLAHLRVLADRVAIVDGADGVDEKLLVVETSLDAASASIGALNAEGYFTGEPYLGRVDALRSALSSFRSAEGV
ncbi:hypothetical protein [uncultured Demequina sp.]|uniref:hypothetical protein n=1 Tax=uncultured Demequina sp. TaxID=693499 RepID=UPI0025F127E2|nr:hypothetical protein [uncultured Demequina sp.]